MPTTFTPRPVPIVSLVNVSQDLPRAEEWPIATEEELLAFANKIREAGGANILEALLPSDPGIPGRCLIANALNFTCSVMGAGLPDEDNRDKANYYFDDEGRVIGNRWGMFLPQNMDAERAQAIADSLGLYYAFGVIHLPVEIGNAAYAFDSGKAFTQYVR